MSGETARTRLFSQTENRTKKGKELVFLLCEMHESLLLYIRALRHGALFRAERIDYGIHVFLRVSMLAIHSHSVQYLWCFVVESVCLQAHLHSDKTGRGVARERISTKQTQKRENHGSTCSVLFTRAMMEKMACTF